MINPLHLQASNNTRLGKPLLILHASNTFEKVVCVTAVWPNIS